MMNEKRRLKVGKLGCMLLVMCIGLSFPGFSQARKSDISGRLALHNHTDWRVVPSFKFDVLCFLNVMTGDPFYVQYYRKEYSDFEPRLTPTARRALNELKRKLKDENNNIISAFLCLHFSATDDASIDDMLRTLDHREGMKRNLKQTVYFNDAGWRLFESVAGDLKIALRWLKEAGFTEYWTQNVLPTVQPRKLTLEKDLSAYDVVPEIEKRLGFALGSNAITIYLLYFAKPHGIRVTGTRFVVDVSYPLKVVLQNAIHEMMHPPYRLSDDRELRVALAKLKTDAFLMDKILNHNPSFGYNTFDGFIEENSVRALEQVVTERLNIGREARRRWKDEDDGIHVFAVALYELMRQENFSDGRENFRAFLKRMLSSGKLAPGKIKPLYDAFYSSFRSGEQYRQFFWFASNAEDPRHTPGHQRRQSSS